MNAREVTLNMLMQILEDKKLSHKVLKEGLAANSDLSKQDRSFISILVTGCVERRITLDMDINRFSKVKTAKMKPVVRNVLRMGLYQLKYMTQIPESAICNEAVKLVKKKGLSGLSGFVNGVLRSMVRERDSLKNAPDGLSKKQLLSYQYSMPEEMTDFFISTYGLKKAEQIMCSFFDKKEVCVRVNTQKISVEDCIIKLNEEGVTVKSGKIVKEALILQNFDSLTGLKCFQEGLFTVQDESSMLVGMIAGIKKNDQILDLCAAPGGKSLHAAQLLCGTGHVKACDKTQSKVDLLNENIKRSGFLNIDAVVNDALVLNKNEIEKYDVVIADLPCSGLGVIKRKPDIKYNMTRKMMEELAMLQHDILKVAVKYVKRRGTLIFSTCTVNPAENRDNFNYLVNELNMVPESLDEYLPEKLHSEETKNGSLLILPGEFGTDGFFISRVTKK